MGSCSPHRDSIVTAVERLATCSMLRPILLSTFTALLGGSPALAQCEVAHLFDPSPNVQGYFGMSIALRGSEAFVGAGGDTTVGGRTGSLTLLSRGAGGWQIDDQLTPAGVDDGGGFGAALDVDGSWLAVGAPWQSGSATFAGAVYLLQRSATGWSVVQRLDGEGPSNSFGTSLDLHDERLLVGAPMADGPGTAGTGAAYVYRRSAGTWQLEQKLTSANGANGDGFGGSVALFGKRLLVGAPSADHAGAASGSTFFFERGGAGWTLRSRIESPIAAPFSFFGRSVALDGPSAWVGEPGAGPAQGDNFGAVHVYDLAGGAMHRQLIHSPSASTNAFFGTAVRVSGDRLLVGANTADDRAFLYERFGGTWLAKAELSPPAGAQNGNYGFSIAIEGRTLIVGGSVESGAGVPGGAIHIFEGDPAARRCSASPNSTGEPARLSTSGCSSVSANSLSLIASPVPDQPGLFLYSATQGRIPLADGLLCVGQPFYRLPVCMASGGRLVHALNVVAPPTPAAQITAGSTWYFQAWYRDPAAGGTGANLSDALLIRFSP